MPILDRKRSLVASLVHLVTEGFIWAVGITRPKPGKENSAAAFISLSLLGGVLAVALTFFFLLSLF